MKEKTGTDPREVRKTYRVFMEQTSPENPFGPNYFKLPLITKLGYKYNMLKNYIITSEPDNQRLEDEQLRFVGILITGLTGGYALGVLTRKLFFRWQMSQGAQSLYYLTMMAVGFTYSYFFAYERYSREVNEYFLNNYMQQAVINGFKDYTISI